MNSSADWKLHVIQLHRSKEENTKENLEAMQLRFTELATKLLMARSFDEMVLYRILDLMQDPTQQDSICSMIDKTGQGLCQATHAVD